MNIYDRVCQIIDAESKAVEEQLHVVDKTDVETVVNILCECKGKVFVTGCGTSGAAAKKIAHTLCCINRPAMYFNPADAIHGGSGVLTNQDVMIIISKGGATPELVTIAEICKRKGSITIAISEKKGSLLTDICDYCLKVKVTREPDSFNMLATASTLSVIAVMDAIAICVMEKTGFSREDFSVIHPGGAVGNRLLNKKE